MEEKEPTTRENPSPDDGATVLRGHRPAGHIAPGLKVGHYTIREVLGEGGFAVVYLAEQTEPVRRRVALKVIKLGMDTKQVLARFEAERQALAMMDHPNVAKVFDAGVTDDGRSYFVMEHVPGIPITEHCDRQRLSIEQRLQLFMSVCDAVQHAHQKGIIHRDLKPGNVLVSTKEGSAVPKVIDFGVAKALHQRLTEKTLYTEQGQLIGTPEYMSPEQAEMTAQDIDTRSDIYSLGVLLYELLTGALPFDPKSLRKAAFAEIQRTIRQEEPPKPSTKLSGLGDESTTYAQRRRADPKSLLRELRGDLDWIVMKALEKDRTRRYGTASELARDVARHLAGDAVEAAPPSARYRASRFLRKHKTILNLVASAVLGWSVLIMGTGLFGTALDMGGGGGAISDILLAVFGMIVIVAFPLGLAVVSVIMWRIDRSRHSFLNIILAGLWIAALVSYVLIVTVQFPRSMSYRRATDRVAEQYVNKGRYDEAEARYVERLENQRSRLGDEDQRTIATMQDLAELHVRQGRYQDAESLYLESLAIRSRVVDEEQSRVTSAIEGLVDFYDTWGKPEKAAEWRAKLPEPDESAPDD